MYLRYQHHPSAKGYAAIMAAMHDQTLDPEFSLDVRCIMSDASWLDASWEPFENWIEASEIRTALALELT
jgi:hypothetical protein